MVYIQSNENKRVAITEFHYTPNMIIVVYKVYRQVENEIQDLFKDKLILRDMTIINFLLNQQCKILNAFDCVCKNILQYMIDNEIQQGTIEVKNG